MNRLLDMMVGIGLFIISIILWLYVLVISSDFTGNISRNKFIIALVGLVLFGGVYSAYYRGKRRTIAWLLIIPLLFWFIDMVNAIKYNYQNYFMLLTMIGFSITLLCIGQSIYKTIINIKKKSEYY